MYAGFDKDEQESMNPDERREALEDAGLDADDFDFDWLDERGRWYMCVKVHLDNIWRYFLLWLVYSIALAQ